MIYMEIVVIMVSNKMDATSTENGTSVNVRAYSVHDYHSADFSDYRAYRGPGCSAM